MSDIYVGQLVSSNTLEHHGILGMKWGVRRFQNKDGSLTSAGKKRKLVNEHKNETEKKRENRHDRAARASQRDADDLRKHGYTKEADAVQKVADRQREKANAKREKAARKQEKISNRKLAREVGRIYKEESKKEYTKAVDKLEKYTGKKYYDLNDTIQKTAAKNTTDRITQKYGNLSTQQEAFLSASRKGKDYMTSMRMLREDGGVKPRKKR